MTLEYQQFYEEHKNRLFSYLLYMCGDYDASLDIMQESFTRHFASYREQASPALLFTIARNALVDHQRPAKRQSLVAEVPEIAVSDSEENARIREDMQKIRKAVDKLPETEREILSLAVGGLAYREIAVILGTSETNIKVRIHRARIRLRQMLNKEEIS